MAVIMFSMIFMMIMYILMSYVYFFSIVLFMRNFPVLAAYYKRHWWVVPLLPVFNLLMFFVRMAGIMNSINTTSAWKTKTLTDEGNSFVSALKDVVGHIFGWIPRLRKAVNTDDE